MVNAGSSRSLYSWMAVVLLFAILLSGCVPASPGSSTAPADAPADGEKVTLRVQGLSGPPVSSVLEMLSANFEESHPDVDVKIEVGTGDYAEGVYAMAAAGNLPDVIFTADIFTAPFVDAGVLVDMEALAEADAAFDLDDVYESILGLGRVEGTPGLYMIPASLDTVQMYYNKTMWEEAGAELPQPDWTWDDLIAACKQIQAAKPDVKCWGLGSAEGNFDWWAYWVPWVVGYGGDVLSEDGRTSTLSTPESLAGLQAYADLWVKHDIVVPLGSDLGGNCFINQRCAFFLHIPGLISKYREAVAGAFEWDVQLTPAHPEAHVTGMGTFGFAISSNSEHPELAWEYLKYLLSPDGQRTLAETRIGMPLLKSMAEDPVFETLDAPPANLQAFIQGGDIGIFPRTYPVKCGSLYSGQVNAAIKTGLEEIIRGAKSAEEAFAAIDAEIQDCLDSAQ